MSFYDEIGGLATISRIVDVFYAGVAEDDLLRPMYPEEELDGAKQRLTLFLAQYWGGLTTYSDHRGHPRLRMRHAPYEVTHAAREQWLLHFRAGLDAVELDAEHDAMFWEYVNMAALHMVNSLD